MFVLLLLCTCVGVCGASTYSIPTYDDPIVGTWVGVDDKLIYAYNVTLVCNEKKTAELVGFFSVLGKKHSLHFKNLVWEHSDEYTYVVSGDGRYLLMSLQGNDLTMTVNPVTLGVTTDTKYDQNISITLKRADDSVSTSVETNIITNIITAINNVWSSVLDYLASIVPS